MTTLFAQPYDICANGFFFETAADYAAKAARAINAYGQPVEEFEIQFIDGSAIDAALAAAWRPSQVSIAAFIAACDEWSDHEKRAFIVAVGECGYSFDPATVAPDDFDVDIYETDSLRDLAQQFIDDGLFGDIPERIAGYLDLDAIARDLGFDYVETTIAGSQIIYRCG